MLTSQSLAWYLVGEPSLRLVKVMKFLVFAMAEQNSYLPVLDLTGESQVCVISNVADDLEHLLMLNCGNTLKNMW